jgi:hypothetical protein
MTLQNRDGLTAAHVALKRKAHNVYEYLQVRN